MNDKEEFQAQILTNSKNYMASSTALPVYKWVHVAVVINVPYKTLSTFVNGTLVNETKNVDVELRQLCSKVIREKPINFISENH
jgi:hypothetical protein